MGPKSSKPCECGCGETAPLATVTNRKWGHVKGQPLRFIHGHHTRRVRLRFKNGLELAWLAGILEGEGSFVVCRRTRHRKSGPWTQTSIRVCLSMTDEDIVVRAAELMGTSYWADGKRDGFKQRFTTHLSGPEGVRLMKFLRPFMGLRRQAQIDKALGAIS
jgi:hypothetical protein